MPPKRSKVTIEGEEDIMLTKRLMEDLELKRLIRENRLQRDTSEKDAITEKQRKVIQALTRDGDNLVSSLEVMQSQQQCLKDFKQANHIKHLFSEGDTLDLEIAREKQFIIDLETQIQKESKAIERQRRNIKATVLASDFLETEENKKADRLQMSWQSRLHSDKVQLSSAKQENAEMRKKIEVLLRSKSHFNRLYDELLQKLTRGKKILADLVAEANAQFKKRDEMTRKIQALKDRDEADLRKRQEEMQDLEMKFEEDSTMAKFKQRVQQVRKKISQGAKETKKASLFHKQEQKILRDMYDIWEKIQKETNLMQASEVCDLIVHQESENFTLFNFNNELRYRLEEITDRTVELAQLVDEEQQKAYQLEEDQELYRYEMERRKKTVEEVISDCSESYEAAQRLFDRLLSKIRALFDLMEVDRWPLQQLLGENGDVTEFNYRLYLSLLEGRLMAVLGDAGLSPACPPPALPKPSSIMSQLQRTATAYAPEDRKAITQPCPDCEEMCSKKRITFFA